MNTPPPLPQPSRTPSRFTLRLIWAFVAVAIVLAIFLFAKTVTTTGDQARAKTTAEEKAYLDRFDRLQIGMSYGDVIAVIGEPDREGMRLRPSWRVNGSETNQISAYFADGKLRKVRWLAMGRFVLEKT